MIGLGVIALVAIGFGIIIAIILKELLGKKKKGKKEEDKDEDWFKR
jgi:hypothetical protein